ncbi:MAG: hypothetical protein WDW38_007199 [Sanguina aurantia]
MSETDAALLSIVQACAPTPADTNARVNIIQRITRVSKNLGLENPGVQPYGSYLSGFYNASSDLDLAITGQIYDYHMGMVDLSKLEKAGKGKFLSAVARELLKARICTRDSCFVVKHARVPILKFMDYETGVEVDICCGSEGTYVKATTAGLLKHVNPAFTQLFSLVKLWAKAYNINDGSTQTFNSWCLTLLVVFFMQQQTPALLPPLYKLFGPELPQEGEPRLLASNLDLTFALSVCNTRCLSAHNDFGSLPFSLLALLTGFFKIGAAMFGDLVARLPQQGKSQHLRLSPWLGRVFEGKPFQKSYVFLMEDPFDADDNPGRTLGNLDDRSSSSGVGYIARVFAEGLAHLTEFENKQRPLSSTLLRLFGPGLFKMMTPGQLAQDLGFGSNVVQRGLRGVEDAAANREDLWRTLLYTANDRDRPLLTWQEYKDSKAPPLCEQLLQTRKPARLVCLWRGGGGGPQPYVPTEEETRLRREKDQRKRDRRAVRDKAKQDEGQQQQRQQGERHQEGQRAEQQEGEEQQQEQAPPPPQQRAHAPPPPMPRLLKQQLLLQIEQIEQQQQQGAGQQRRQQQQEQQQEQRQQPQQPQHLRKQQPPQLQQQQQQLSEQERQQERLSQLQKLQRMQQSQQQQQPEQPEQQVAPKEPRQRKQQQQREAALSMRQLAVEDDPLDTTSIPLTGSAARELLDHGQNGGAPVGTDVGENRKARRSKQQQQQQSAATRQS